MSHEYVVASHPKNNRSIDLFCDAGFFAMHELCLFRRLFASQERRCYSSDSSLPSAPACAAPRPRSRREASSARSARLRPGAAAPQQERLALSGRVNASLSVKNDGAEGGSGAAPAAEAVDRALATRRAAAGRKARFFGLAGGPSATWVATAACAARTAEEPLVSA